MIWVQLIAQYGIPAAYKIWADWKDKNDPTEADWQELLKLVNTPLEDYEKPKA
tara:strand:+ start:2193 stop:2351 length:159 start_codon:yes stop_codon:yes gene_type:complete